MSKARDLADLAIDAQGVYNAASFIVKGPKNGN